MKRLIATMLIALSLTGCAPLLGALMTGGAAPPQAPAQVINISRGAIDFALNSFDAALYGLDAAMDAKLIIPGSPRAKQIAAAGRKVMAALGGLEAMRDAASSSSYSEAWSKANEALREFRSLVGTSNQVSGLVDRQLTPADRDRMIQRLAA